MESFKVNASCLNCQKMERERRKYYKSYCKRMRSPSSNSSGSSSDGGPRYHYEHLFIERHPLIWEGHLHLKKNKCAVSMHYVSGHCNLARKVLPPIIDGEIASLKIVQRLKMEPPELYPVKQKFQLENEHCVLLALPCGMSRMEYVTQSRIVRNNFISYFEKKKSAGIVNVALNGSKTADYTIHIFPTCDFTNEKLSIDTPNVLRSFKHVTYLTIVITTVYNVAPRHDREAHKRCARTEPPAPSA